MQQTLHCSSMLRNQGIQNCLSNNSFEDTDKHQSRVKQNPKDKFYDADVLQIINSVKQQLNTANQILPSHKNIKDLKEKASFKLSSTTFYKDRVRFNNQTVFPSLGFNNKKVNYSSINIQDRTLIDIKQQMGEFSMLFNDKKQMIYQRILNDKLNYLYIYGSKIRQKITENKVKTKHFSSIFINSKLPKNKCQQRPIWQHLKQVQQLQQNPLINDDVLRFDSSFQSGNLFSVFRDMNVSTIPTYELFMQNDTNTKGCTQWFYFKVTNKIRMKAKLKILNFYKPKSLYEVGMKVLVSTDGIQWRRVGIAIAYAQNNLLDSGKDSYNLEFIYDFEHSGQEVYFAYGFPYSYTFGLIPYFQNILKKKYRRKCLTKNVLCKSNMGNDIFLLSITNKALNLRAHQKPIIYVIARQHPGETPGSYVIEGIINFLLSNRVEAQMLREQFQFRIIPMVNVDGVISGNYRANISGHDINRQWLFPSKTLHPQIYHLKQEILGNKKYVTFFLDIHAHSRKMNSFFYGCKQRSKSNKFYPFVCSKLNNKFISYLDSSFGQDAAKQSTARVVMQKQLNLTNSLTFEISFFGWQNREKKTKNHWKTSDLEQIGTSLAMGLFYTQIGIKKLKQNEQFPQSNQKQKTIYKNSQKIYQKWKSQLQKQTKDQDQMQSQGSSINPQQFMLINQQIMNIQSQNIILNQINQQQQDDDMKRNKFTIDNSKNSSKQYKLFTNSYGYMDIQQGYNKNSISKGNKRYCNKFNNKIGDIDKFYNLQENQQDINNKKSNLISYSSGNQFFLMSSRDFMVNRLQMQLQNKNKSKPQSQRIFVASSIDQEKLKMKKSHIQELRQTLRYHDKVNQIKKAFNYCLNNNVNADFDYYKSCYKSIGANLNGDFSQLKLNKNQYKKPRRQLSLKEKRKQSTQSKKQSQNMTLERI